MDKEDFKYALPVGTLLRSPNREYRIEKVLGVGGFGITYKVSATLVYQNVPIFTYFAVKEHFLKDACERDAGSAGVVYSRPSKARVEESRKDFLSEAERLNALSGQVDNIVPVSEVFEANNTVYYVMEYLNGGSLSDIVKAGGPLPEQRALEIIEPVARAVAFLHSHRINHLDIKPDNIMFKTTPDGSKIPVIIDFGLAKHYDGNGRPTSTVRVQGCSDGYAPVEQYAGLNTFVPQADVYALGATLYYMLVGKDPAIATEQTSAGIVQSLPKTLDRPVVNAIVVAATVMLVLDKKGNSYGLRDGEYEYIDELGAMVCDSVVSDSVVYYGDEAVVTDTVAPVDDYYDEPAAVDTAAEW